MQPGLRIEISVLLPAGGPLLQACDRLRDETLAELGVRLEDKEGV